MPRVYMDALDGVQRDLSKLVIKIPACCCVKLLDVEDDTNFINNVGASCSEDLPETAQIIPGRNKLPRAVLKKNLWANTQAGLTLIQQSSAPADEIVARVPSVARVNLNGGCGTA